MTEKKILNILEKMYPKMKRSFLQRMFGLCQHTVKRQHLDDDGEVVAEFCVQCGKEMKRSLYSIS